MIWPGLQIQPALIDIPTFVCVVFLTLQTDHSSVLAIAVFLIALGVHPRDLATTARKRKVLLVGLILGFAVFPAIGAIVLKNVPLSDNFKIGIAILAASPTGDH